MITKRIRVMRRHIDNGVCGNANKCAIALAVKEALPKANSIDVGSTISFKIGKTPYTMETPRKARNFIVRFDQDKSKKHKRSLKTMEFKLRAAKWVDTPQGGF